MTAKEIAAELRKLSESERNEIIAMFGGSEIYKEESKDEFMMEKRFAGGVFCPHCGSHHVAKNGTRASGKQNFLCMDCRRQFTSTTGTILSGSPKSLSVWKKYVESLMNGDSLRKSAGICKIDLTTAFYWRHKILDALENMAGSVTLSGISEADEKYFRISYKGNRSKSGQKIPRESRKRGKGAKRGLSDEQVCVVCAVNREGLSVSVVSNSGKPSSGDIDRALGGKIAPGSILCTDKMNSYKKFAEKNSLDLHQSKAAESRSGIYNIQKVNSYHSCLDRFMTPYNGVSTKYLPHYLILNNIVNYAMETFLEKQNIFIDFVFTTRKTEKSRDVRKRPLLPWAA